MTVQTISTSPPVKRYTLQEFWERPELPGGGHHELIGGVLYMVPPPSGPHNSAWAELSERLYAFVIGHPGIGRVFAPCTAIWIDDDTYIRAAAGSGLVQTHRPAVLIEQGHVWKSRPNIRADLAEIDTKASGCGLKRSFLQGLPRWTGVQPTAWSPLRSAGGKGLGEFIQPRQHEIRR
jgi:hypothetical protein